MSQLYSRTKVGGEYLQSLWTREVLTNILLIIRYTKNKIIITILIYILVTIIAYSFLYQVYANLVNNLLNYLY